MVKNLIKILVKIGKTPSLIFSLTSIGLLVINLGIIPIVLGQIPIEINSGTTTINRPTLRIGSQGEEVSELQAVLKLLGYYLGEVDGVYSDSTASAVVQFQEVAGLMPNGIVNQDTWNRLLPSVPTSNSVLPTQTDTSLNCDCPQNQSSTTNPDIVSAETDLGSEPLRVNFPILKIGMRGNAVRGLQERLKAKGFFKGRVDGIFGPQTLNAVQVAQRKYQQQPNGIVDDSLWIVLLQ
ncbi:MAG: peptidoglycan-binding protein [Microcoleaceae cyanobacterium MO_207.B10]|nr:peptidoglycan-binding protein [Microcoleaceae cyanobacterium MO_207.B10]